jgi:ankyrin repeat protein
VSHPIEQELTGCSSFKLSPSEIVTRQNANDSIGTKCLLSVAWTYQRMDYFRELLTKGADPKRCGADFSTEILGSIIRTNCQPGLVSVSTKFQEMETLGIKATENQKLLGVAVEAACPEIVEKMIQKGADANYIDDRGFSLLNTAVMAGTTDRTIATVRVLVKLGADPNLPSPKTGTTPIQNARQSFASSRRWPELEAALLGSP